MKPIDKYISEVYEKYNETEKEHQIYETVKMKPKNSFKPVCCVMVCTVLAICLGLGVQNYFSQEKVPIQYAEAETRGDGTKVFIDKISVDMFENEKQLKKLIANSEFIVITSKEDYISTDFKEKNGKFLLRTENQLKIQKVLKGNLDEIENIFCYKYGGELPIKSIEKNESINWPLWESEHIGYNLSDSEKEKAIFKQITTKDTNFEDGKQYLTFLDFDEERGKYEIFDLAYGIMEYDPITNKVKNVDTGEFEDFDWNLIEKAN